MTKWLLAAKSGERGSQFIQISIVRKISEKMSPILARNSAKQKTSINFNIFKKKSGNASLRLESSVKTKTNCEREALTRRKSFQANRKKYVFSHFQNICEKNLKIIWCLFHIQQDAWPPKWSQRFRSQTP